MYILIEIYNSSFPNRNKEMREALNKNLECEHIEKIVVFCENGVEVPKHDKIISVISNDRMTFADYFNYANTHIKDKVCGIANADIYFDDTLKHMKKLQSNEFVCLTRWENNQIMGRFADCSQDSWFFKGKIEPKMIAASTFYLGTLRCDNQISYLAILCGYNVFNPSELISSHHLHEVEKERSYSEDYSGDASKLSRVAPTSEFKYDEDKIASFLGMFGGHPSGGFYKKTIREYLSN